MNAGELRTAIADVPDDREVIVSRDSEGNRFSPLAEVETDARWDGTDPIHEDDFDPEEDGAAEEVVLLWPTA